MAEQESKAAQAERAMYGALAEAQSLLDLFDSVAAPCSWATLAHGLLERLTIAVDVHESLRRAEG